MPYLICSFCTTIQPIVGHVYKIDDYRAGNETPGLNVCQKHFTSFSHNGDYATMTRLMFLGVVGRKIVSSILKPIKGNKIRRRQARKLYNANLKNVLFVFSKDKEVEYMTKEKKEKKSREPSEKALEREEKKKEREEMREKKVELAKEFIDKCEKEGFEEKQTRSIARLMRRITQGKE